MSMYWVNFVVGLKWLDVRWFVLESGVRYSFTVIRQGGIREQSLGWFVALCPSKNPHVLDPAMGWWRAGCVSRPALSASVKT